MYSKTNPVNQSQNQGPPPPAVTNKPTTPSKSAPPSKPAAPLKTAVQSKPPATKRTVKGVSKLKKVNKGKIGNIFLVLLILNLSPTFLYLRILEVPTLFLSSLKKSVLEKT